MLVRFRGKAAAVAVAVAAVRFHGFADLLSLYSFKSQCLYSTSASSAPTHLLAKYLVDSLGFSKQEASLASAKVTSRKHFNNPDLVINFLKQTGFDDTQVKKLVFTTPKLLFSDVSKTLQPKFQCLMDLGLSRSDLVKVMARDTTIVNRGLVTHLRPTIDFLRKLLGSDENVVKALKRTSWLFSFGAHHIMKNNVLLLRNSGVSDANIRKVVHICPNYLTQKPEWVKDMLHRLEKDFAILLHSPIFPYGFHTLAAQKKSKYEKKIGIFKSFGWSDDDVLMMFRKLPYCLALSEEKIQKALSYMKNLGCEPTYLASHPSVLVFSLEKRVVPRVQVLKILDEKKLERRKLGLYYALSITETKFMEYFVLPYKDQIPDLYEQLKKIVDPYFRSQYLYSSTSIHTHFLVKYLVDSLGFSDEEAASTSSKVKIQKALNLYINELGHEPAYLASQPSVLIYSLEKRVVPRMQVLKILDKKKLERRKLALYTVVSLSETKFIDYFVLPYKDQIPDLYESHKKTMAP
ncbi:uncharacterized protein LOC129903529 [Solanum dulcamara]|uniref:uncharacterized protein LOC129903529 n=1 Tax=Solanum dulcamara TaxID=45834 RepID=UPI0024864762|nr:uncharacterized protein LOC129903529 [Solanum dulcamara]